ncbi:glycosyl transferase [Brachionus plicatilis]|uniref:Glycosyl transferase n=1 Tax=Brachionus plicatilis TaxID=10195 RepID=A0A3M7PN29_BRAPC|nr:glycosyl transferase [Brachionus plicatilis]
MNSSSETIHYGVPIIGIPIKADQPLVAHRICEELKFGVRLDPFEIDSNNLQNAISKILNDDSYSTNIKEMSKISKNSHEKDLLINPTTSQAVNVDDNEHDEDFIEDKNEYDEEIEDSVDENEIEEMIEEFIDDKILKNVSEEIISSLLDSVISELSFQAKRGRNRRIELDKENDDILPISTSEHPCFQSNAIKIQDIQNDCHENLKNAADLIAKQHIHKLGEAKIGDTVQVTVPDVDRGSADPVNILAYVTKINNHQLYQLATQHGLRFSSNCVSPTMDRYESDPQSISPNEHKELRSLTWNQQVMRNLCTMTETVSFISRMLTAIERKDG